MNPTPPAVPVPPSPPAKPATRWPKVVGIVAIVFGAGGLLGALSTPAGLYITKSQMNAYTEIGIAHEETDAYLAQLTTQSYVGAAIQGALGILLLFGGIVLVQRRRLASPLLQSWAVVKIVAGGFLLFQSMSLSRTQMRLIYESAEVAASSGGGGGSGLGEMENSIMKFTEYAMWAGLGIGLLWLAALPVFFIAWFNRERIRDEMEGW